MSQRPGRTVFPVASRIGGAGGDRDAAVGSDGGDALALDDDRHPRAHRRGFTVEQVAIADDERTGARRRQSSCDRLRPFREHPALERAEHGQDRNEAGTHRREPRRFAREQLIPRVEPDQVRCEVGHIHDDEADPLGTTIHGYHRVDRHVRAGGRAKRQQVSRLLRLVEQECGESCGVECVVNPGPIERRDIDARRAGIDRRPPPCRAVGQRESLEGIRTRGGARLETDDRSSPVGDVARGSVHFVSAVPAADADDDGVRDRDHLHGSRMAAVVDDLVAERIGRRLDCDEGDERERRSDHDPSVKRVACRCISRIGSDPCASAEKAQRRAMTAADGSRESYRIDSGASG
jgi:hypothetical protein